MNATTWAFKSAETDGALELHIYDDIGSSWFSAGVTAKDVLAQISAEKNLKSIHMRVYSLGGILDDGKAIHNLLREKSASGVKVSAQVDAIAASAATFPVIAADHVTIAKNAMFMIHEGGAGTPGRGTAEDHAKIADRIDRENDQMAEMYAAASARRGKNVSAKDFRLKMKKETYLSPEEAVELGLADSVGSDSEASAVAACAFGIGRLSDPPSGLVRLVASLHQPSPSHRQQQTSATRSEPEEKPMTFPRLLAALGLNTEANENSVMAAFDAKLTELRRDKETSTAALDAKLADLRPRASLADKLEQALGKTGEEAVGIAMAAVKSHAELPRVTAELAAIKAEASKNELASLIKDARDAKKLTKAEADKLSEQVTSGEISLTAAKAFVGVMAPKPHLAASVEASSQKDPNAAGAPPAQGIVAHAGRAWEDMSVDDRVRLRSSSDEGEEIYAALRANWEERGKPTKPRASSAGA